MYLYKRIGGVGIIINHWWENFANVIEKVKEACKNAEQNIEDHLPDVRKTIAIGSGAEKGIDDMLF